MAVQQSHENRNQKDHKPQGTVEQRPLFDFCVLSACAWNFVTATSPGIRGDPAPHSCIVEVIRYQARNRRSEPERNCHKVAEPFYSALEFHLLPFPPDGKIVIARQQSVHARSDDSELSEKRLSLAGSNRPDVSVDYLTRIIQRVLIFRDRPRAEKLGKGNDEIENRYHQHQTVVSGVFQRFSLTMTLEAAVLVFGGFAFLPPIEVRGKNIVNDEPAA
mmetsp:Transcript_6738/g.16554  ORF Transcript_6738/g.16554 Transcript_6738/m.16554 type:complete len:218 (+) Transcript_6738:734-1387(+)